MKWVSIQEVAEVNPKVPKSVSDQTSTSVTFLPMAAVSEEGTIDAPEEAELGDVLKGYRYFESEDVLLAKITPCMENGKATFVEGVPHKIGFGSTEFHVLRPKPDIFGRYLFYMVWNPAFRHIAELNMTGTAGQRRVPTDFVKRYQIPLPPIEEQRRIAAILDKADGVRRKRKEAIALTEDLLRAAFLDMFGDPVSNPKGWDIKPLGEIAQFVGGGTPSRKVPKYFEGDICWATSKDMGVDILSDTQEHITEEAINNSATKLVQAGCLLVVVKSKVLMHRLPVARSVVPACFGQDLKAIIPIDLGMTRYLHRHLKFGQEILLRQARGVNTEGLTLDHLRSFPVIMPAMKDIEQFVNLDIQLEISGKDQLCSAKDADNLFNSLLQRAFRGEL